MSFREKPQTQNLCHVLLQYSRLKQYSPKIRHDSRAPVKNNQIHRTPVNGAYVNGGAAYAGVYSTYNCAEGQLRVDTENNR